MYLAGDDARSLINRLNEDDEIAFIVETSPEHWQAVREVHELPIGMSALWHVPGGPLRVLNDDGPDEVIKDPWNGWSSPTYTNAPIPNFGPGWPSTLVLDLFLEDPRTKSDAIPMSSLSRSNLGDSSERLGLNPTLTQKWWRRFGSWVRRSAIQIPREGSIEGANPEIWCFPEALAQIREGKPRALNVGYF